VRHVLYLLLPLTLAACGLRAADPTGGIEGTVTMGPTCPVEVAGSPCPPGVWSGTVRATAADGSSYATETDAEGNYTLALPPGTYEVTAVVEGGGPPTATPVTVTVTAGPFQRVGLQVDTGIR
jgi:hypothetical protein